MAAMVGYDPICVNYSWITRADGTRDVVVMFSGETWAGIVAEERTANPGGSTALPFDPPLDREWVAIGKKDRKLYNSIRGLELLAKGSDRAVRTTIRVATAALIKSLTRDPEHRDRAFFDRDVPPGHEHP